MNDMFLVDFMIILSILIYIIQTHWFSSPWNVIRQSGNQHILLRVTSRPSISGRMCCCKGHVNVGVNELWKDNCDSWLYLSVFCIYVNWWSSGLICHLRCLSQVKCAGGSPASSVVLNASVKPCILDSAVAEQFGFRLDIKYALMVTWLRFRLGLKLLD